MSARLRAPALPLRNALAGPSRLRPIVPLPSPATAISSPLINSRRAKSTQPFPSPSVSVDGPEIALPKSVEPQVTTLPNRIRVVTEPAPGHINTVALTIDAGTRYESARSSGVTHLLDKLAWQSNARYTADEMALATAQLGNSLYNIGARDSFFYGASTFPSQLPLAIQLISSNVLNPLLLPEEVESAKDSALYETQVMWSSAKQVIPEIILQTAFEGNTLGMPSALSEEQASKIGQQEIRSYLKDWFRPERMVITGLGMPHEELVDLVYENFQFADSTPSTVKSLPSSSTRSDAKLSQGKTYATVSNADVPLVSEYDSMNSVTARYTGGEKFIEKEDEQFTHLAIAFEAPKVSDPDVYATAVMQQLLLGGSSFSQGGPGKGMYSRLNQNVLNRHYWVDLCQSFHDVFTDSGLFGIRIAVNPDQASRAASIMCAQLHALTGNMMSGITEEQLTRAKNMLKAFLVMGTEARMVAAEDLGRQFLTQGFKESTELMCSKVDSVSKSDIYRVATRIFRPDSRTTPLNAGIGSGEPTIVGMGKNVAGLGDVRSVLRKWDLGSR